MSTTALSNYVVFSKYSKPLPEKQRRETWKEQVDRVFDMHCRRYSVQLKGDAELQAMFQEAREAVYAKEVLGSQRALQFGGDSIEKHNEKMYNCATTYIDRVSAFSQIMYCLLCGNGVGFSVQKHHVAKMPSISAPGRIFGGDTNQVFTIPDSIEGWGDSIDMLVKSYFDGHDSRTVEFDYSLIRPEGAPISGGFKAPGPKGLREAHEKIRAIFDNAVMSRTENPSNNKSPKVYLKPIEAYDCIMHSADAVLSGGVRRAATICIFSKDDEEMLNAKTGNWFYKNPQRGRSNNSVLLVRGETTEAEFKKIMESVRHFGEPGFIWAESTEHVFNPCVEIGMIPKTVDGQSGIQYCNLTEMNGRKCKDKETFLRLCRISAIIGTIQVGYDSFKYLGKVSEDIVKHEALLGCSITGWMDNPEVLFDTKLQREGANIIRKTNRYLAPLLNVNVAARTTCCKPAGTTSCVLGTASGVHPHNSKRYIRNVQGNINEFSVQEFERLNPIAVEDSVWDAQGKDKVLSFMCEVPAGAITKNMVSALDLLDKVKQIQQNWVEAGTNPELCVDKTLRHNVSNTITVKDDEWEDVGDYIYKNRAHFAGISLLAASGDLDYPQAPFISVLTPIELVKEYGDASILASGLVVDGLSAFNNNLWAACDVVSGIVNDPDVAKTVKLLPYPAEPTPRKLANYFDRKDEYETSRAKKEWVRRVIQFANRHFDYCIETGPDQNGNDLKLKRCCACLKHVSIWKRWVDLRREYVDINWNKVREEGNDGIDVDTLGAQACAGGQCTLT